MNNVTRRVGERVTPDASLEILGAWRKCLNEAIEAKHEANRKSDDRELAMAFAASAASYLEVCKMLEGVLTRLAGEHIARGITETREHIVAGWR